jgi:radical SAM-linked protein
MGLSTSTPSLSPRTHLVVFLVIESPPTSPPSHDAPATPCRIRLRFAKRGELRLVSHHDLMRCLERGLRRAGLPLAMSQGFNPRPKFVFPLALGLGIEGHREVLELELDRQLDAGTVLERLRAALPQGFDLLDAEAIRPGAAGQAAAADYELPIPPERTQATADAVTAFLAAESVPYTRKRPDRTIETDLRPLVASATLDLTNGFLRFRLPMLPSGSARPEEFLEAVGVRDLLGQGAVLRRTDVVLAPDRTPSSTGS